MSFGFAMAGIISGSTLGACIALFFALGAVIDRKCRNMHEMAFLVFALAWVLASIWGITTLGVFIAAAVVRFAGG